MGIFAGVMFEFIKIRFPVAVVFFFCSKSTIRKVFYYLTVLCITTRDTEVESKCTRTYRDAYINGGGHLIGCVPRHVWLTCSLRVTAILERYDPEYDTVTSCIESM